MSLLWRMLPPSYQGLLGPTVPTFWTSNPAYPGPEGACVADGLGRDHSGQATPQAAAEKAFKRVEEIFAKYPITQT